jgi:Yip1-like protein
MQSITLLFKVLWSPGEAMYLLSKSPRVLAPLLFLCIFTGVANGVAFTKIDFADMYMRMIEKTPQGAQMADDQKAQMKRVMSLPVVKAAIPVISVVFTVILILIVAGVYFALFSLIGREGGFKAYLSLTAFAFVPIIFSSIAAVVRAFLMPPTSVMLDEISSLSAGIFIDRDTASPVLFSLANSVDLVSIWILTLLVIGYGFVTRKSVSKGTRAAVVVAVFLAYIGLKLASAAIRGV